MLANFTESIFISKNQSMFISFNKIRIFARIKKDG